MSDKKDNKKEDLNKGTERPIPSKNFSLINQLDKNDVNLTQKIEIIFKNFKDTNAIIKEQIINLIYDKVKISKKQLKTEALKIWDVKEEQNTITSPPTLSQDKREEFEIANDIMNKNGICTLYETDEICLYKNGYYRRDGEGIIRQKITEYIESGDIDYTMNKRNAVIEIIKTKTFVPQSEFNTNKNIVVLKNGIFNFTDFSFEPHKKYDENPYKSFYYINAEYDPTIEFTEEGNCPNIKKFLTEVFGKERIDVIFELISYLILPSVEYQKAFMFYGGGQNGKTKFLELIIKFLNRENVSEVDLQELGERFKAIGLLGKLANIVPDLPSGKIGYSAMFKRIVTDEHINSEVKFKNGNFTFINMTRLVFACNQLPNTSDDTEAFWRRWILFPCFSRFLTYEKMIEEGKEIPKISGEMLSIEKEIRKNQETLKKDEEAEVEKKTDEELLVIKQAIAENYEKAYELIKSVDPNIYLVDRKVAENISTQKELNGLFNECIKGWIRLKENEGFPHEFDDVNFVKKIWTLESNPLKSFIDQCCVLDEKISIDKKKLYDVFCEFRRYFGYEPLSKNIVTRALTKMGVESKQVNIKKSHTNKAKYPSGYKYKGISLRKDWENYNKLENIFELFKRPPLDNIKEKEKIEAIDGSDDFELYVDEENILEEFGDEETKYKKKEDDSPSTIDLDSFFFKSDKERRDFDYYEP